jgi:hypothetical protein
MMGALPCLNRLVSINENHGRNVELRSATRKAHEIGPIRLALNVALCWHHGALLALRTPWKVGHDVTSLSAMARTAFPASVIFHPWSQRSGWSR